MSQNLSLEQLEAAAAVNGSGNVTAATADGDEDEDVFHALRLYQGLHDLLGLAVLGRLIHAMYRDCLLYTSPSPRDS